MSELRVLRYLSTNLTAPEIAGELCVSRHTVKSHMRNLYAKLGTHRRTETVARARDLRLLTPGGHRVARSESSQPSPAFVAARSLGCLIVGPVDALASQDERWMGLAVELAWQCPPSETAYSVGAVIVGADGGEISRGYSREDDDPLVHAEESALRKLAPGDPRLVWATIYSTLEPCSRRKSRPRSCTQLIIAAGIRRVVIAWREPPLFVADCQGVELLTEAGLTVDELPGFAGQAAAPNRHLAV